MESIKDIAAKFEIFGQVTGFEVCGAGHINNTYVVTTKGDLGEFRYVLQKINTNVFKDPDALMRNLVSVSAYIREKILARGGDCGRTSLTFLKTADGSYCYKSKDGGVYRCYVYIGNAANVQTVTDPHHLYLAGKGFGRFQRDLEGFDASTLTEVIEGFHDTVKRFSDFEKAVAENRAGRADGCREEIEFFLKRADYAPRVLNLMKTGEIPLRVTHNDTKINNVLLDLYHDAPLAVIDLDTVMPGSILYDFGDGVRSGTNRGAESEKDLSKVGFDMNLFKAFVKGFAEEVGNALSAAEIDNLAFSGILMTYECGMRFLGDHLNGDVYFKVAEPMQNLDRARTQIKMIREMEERLDEMNAAVKAAVGNEVRA